MELCNWDPCLFPGCSKQIFFFLERTFLKNLLTTNKWWEPTFLIRHIHHNYTSARQYVRQCIERDKKYFFFTSNLWKFKEISAKWRMLLQKCFHTIVLPSQPGIPLDIVMQYRPNMFQDFFNVNLYFIGGTTVWF